MAHQLALTDAGYAFVGEIIGRRLDRALVVLSDLGAGDKDVVEVGREGERAIVRGTLTDIAELMESHE